MAATTTSMGYSFPVTVDANGNIPHVTDDNEALVATYEYGPFGAIASSSGPEVKSHRFKFSTKYWDEESTTYYYGYRYYGPTVGRWKSRDPIEEKGGRNLYAFAQNAVDRYVDPLGREQRCANPSPLPPGAGGEEQPEYGGGLPPLPPGFGGEDNPTIGIPSLDFEACLQDVVESGDSLAEALLICGQSRGAPGIRFPDQFCRYNGRAYREEELRDPPVQEWRRCRCPGDCFKRTGCQLCTVQMKCTIPWRGDARFEPTDPWVSPCFCPCPASAESEVIGWWEATCPLGKARRARRRCQRGGSGSLYSVYM